MKCPRCRQELKEGHLYCEVCGEEIKIVPVFEPEIENSIEETLSNVAENINEVAFDDVLVVDEGESVPHRKEHKKKENAFQVFTKNGNKKKENLLLEDFSDEEELSDDFDDASTQEENFWDEEEIVRFKGGDSFVKIVEDFWKKGLFSKIVVFVAAILVVGVLIFTIVALTGALQEGSYDYQLEQALEAAEEADYDTAIVHMEKALSIDSSDITKKYLLAEYYDKIGETENALLILKGLLGVDTQNDINTYSMIFDIYSRQGNIMEINRILSECEDEGVLEQFQQYIASAPEFSEEAGSYGDVIHLKLTSNTTGTIYYTVNGGTPDTSSDVYTSPIFLESGYYTVKAIFVNSFGLVSEMVSRQYEINVTIPPKPVISVESGTYQVPEVISVEVPEGCTTYYTTDGTMPTRDSMQYKEPICMPLGDSHFTFVTYSVENVASEASMAMYTFELPKDITVSPADAANLVTMYRFGMGGLMDTQGHLATISGKLLYMCEAAVMIEEIPYFVVYEYYEDPNSQLRTRTGLVFCASMYDETKVGPLELDENGQYYMVVKETTPQM